MKKLFSILSTLSLLGLASAHGQVVIDNLGDSYSQDFNSLPTGASAGSATNFDWTNDISNGSNNTIPNWYFSTSNKNFTDSDDGRSIAPTGDISRIGTDRILSLGATEATTDRSMGMRAQGFDTAPDGAAFGLRLSNSTGAAISSLDVEFTAEQWFEEASAGSLDFYYLTTNGTTNYTSLRGEGTDPLGITTNGTQVSQLSYTAPQTSVTDAIIDGTQAANSSNLSHTITGLNWANGDDLWLVWNKETDTSALAIDDLTVTVIPEPSSLALLAGALGLGLVMLRRRR